MDRKVGIYKQDSFSYSERPPYFPPAIFREYPFKEDGRMDRRNKLYASMRQVFKSLELDLKNFDTEQWNPFGSFIFPGDTVLLKPNMVKHSGENGRVAGLITHGSMIRAVTDYTYIALKGKGRIIIADGPMDDGDFEKIADLMGLYELKGFYKDRAGFDIEIYDLRQERVIKKRERIIQRVKLPGDPEGYTSIDMGDSSELAKGSLDFKSFRGAECKTDVMYMHHNDKKHEYLISNTLLNADVVINLPKMKTHKRSGVTLSLKNMIGITGDRNWLPHSSEKACSQKEKGSSDPGVAKKIFSMLKKIIGFVRPLRDRLRYFSGATESTICAGNWYGNDIIWRTIIDLACINLYGKKSGGLEKERQRRSFVIVDGIVAGEGDGPLNPSQKPCGVLVAGSNNLCVDMATARIMGFDPMKIPKFRDISKEALKKICGIDPKDIICTSNIDEWNKALFDIKGRCLGLRPHYGWKDHIESR